MKKIKADLEAQGWVCGTCSCHVSKGYDCAHKLKKGILILVRPLSFKILSKGHVIESGHLYQLPEKLLKHELA